MRSLIAPLALVATLVLAGAALAQEDANVLARFIELAKAGNQAEIVKIADKVVPAAEQVLADSPEALANAFGMIAEAYNSQGQYALAEPLFRRAQASYEKSLGPDHETTLHALRQLAACQALAGDYATAEALLHRFIRAMERMLCGRAYDATIAAASVELAECMAAQGRGGEARGMVARAGELLTRLEWPESPVAARGQAIVAATLAREGRRAEAVEAADQAARAMHDWASRSAAPGRGAEPRDGRPGVRDVLLSLAWRQRAEPGMAARAAAWLVNDKAAADLAARQRATLARLADDPAAAADVERLAAARRDLGALAIGDAACGGDGDGERVAAALAEEARLAATVFAGRERHAAASAAGWTDIDAVRASVPVGRVFVAIGRFVESDLPGVPTDRERPVSRMIAAVVPPAGRGEITIVDLGPADGVDAVVAAHRAGIDAVSRTNGFSRGHWTLENEMRAIGLPVTKAVLEPILAAAGDIEELVIAPDDGLWPLAWHSLPLAADDDSPYAIERYAIRLVTTAAGIVEPGLGADDDSGELLGPAVIVGDPDFGSPTTAAGIFPAVVPRLPGTLAEARAAAAAAETLFAEPPKMLVGTRASEAELKAIRRPRLMSIATHGWGRTAYMEPGMLLAGVNAAAAEADRGLLTATEIERLDLAGTRLAVLSVGGSAAATPRPGGGVADLRHAFLAAGCRQVVAASWELADAESTQIMAAFYANLAKGQPASRALRDAQLAFIKQRRADRNYESAHPYHWAAYGVTGR